MRRGRAGRQTMRCEEDRTAKNEGKSSFEGAGFEMARGIVGRDQV